jgi:hypothetical protein
MTTVQANVDANVQSDAPPARISPNTFSPIRLDPRKFAALSFADFVDALLTELRRLQRQRSAFYEDLRARNSRWANAARWLLAVLGAVALLLTALVAVVRLIPTSPSTSDWEPDRILLVAVLVIYAVMGAISFFERGSDKTTAYFRQIATILAIRDLWTKLQFAILKELRALAAAPDPAAEEATRGRVLAIAETFCTDLDKIATGELSEFRTEFLDSLKELQETSQKGMQDITKQLDEHAKAAEKAAADARVAAEKAAADAKAAAKAAEDAAKPGFVNVTIVGEFDDEVVISVSGNDAAKSTSKTIGLERIPPGPTRIGARAKKGTKVLDAAVIVDVKPGLQECKLPLS